MTANGIFSLSSREHLGGAVAFLPTPLRTPKICRVSSNSSSSDGSHNFRDTLTSRSLIFNRKPDPFFFSGADPISQQRNIRTSEPPFVNVAKLTVPFSGAAKRPDLSGL
uniref:Uncharacterized protein n=1 Tax=Romanomermis culicivorax TaxID=13658 RepID=A0A915II18_ROMCU